MSRRYNEDAKKTEYAGNCGTKPLDVSENFERSKERNESETEKLEENKQDEGAFNDKFDEIKAEIEGVMQSSRSVDKSKIRLVLNAIEGIRIFNGLGIVEGLGCVGNMGEITGSTGPEKVDRRKLAADLKCWELEYEQIFLENSKESDLPKFQEILHWYEAHAYNRL